MSIVVTGGLGYIGSHTCIVLLEAGYDVIVIDNLTNSKQDMLQRMEQISGKNVKYYHANLLEKTHIEHILAENDVQAVIHFAGLKAVAESVAQPLLYYQNNITGTLNLCEAMAKNGIKNLVFSSSATVYGDATLMPIKEETELSAVNPYGRTKLMIEQILTDLYVSDQDFSVALLRYFNPIGAHESGLIGEDPNGIPNNLMPYVTKVAAGKLEQLSVFGDDYDTVDGTGVRDYIHVVDLAHGHREALNYVLNNTGVEAFNLGTGRGHSVLEVIHTFEQVNGVHIPYRIVGRRAGDVATSYADVSKAAQLLRWRAEKSLSDMCRDAWRWEKGQLEM